MYEGSGEKESKRNRGFSMFEIRMACCWISKDKGIVACCVVEEIWAANVMVVGTCGRGEQEIKGVCLTLEFFRANSEK